MPWVESEYAGELAVVAAWIAALLPWNLSYQSAAPPVGGTIYTARFGLLGLQIRPYQYVLIDNQTAPIRPLLREFFPGTNVVGGVYVTTPPSAATFYASLPGTPETTAAGASLFWAGVAWSAGAAVLLLALAFSVVIYAREEEVARRLPVDSVHAMGGLLAAATVALAAATVLFYLGRDVVGLPIPVGVIVVGALAAALLRAERV